MTSSQKAIDAALDSTDFGVATALALQMIEKSSQCRKALAATLAVLVGTVVQWS